MRWRQTITAALAIGIAAAVVIPLDSASAQTSHQRSVNKKKKPVKDYRPQRGGGGQIACTEFGCRPIPRNCRPQTGYRWDGLPSGYDVVVCR
ncbi:MAG: hypothetical protein KIT76_12840 [Pseudolabrys sp.]|nr:hypothetical protein [Pseudolabrys sp.]